MKHFTTNLSNPSILDDWNVKDKDKKKLKQIAFRTALKGSLFGIPFMAYNTAHAQRGEQLATGASSLFIYPAMGMLTTSVCSLIPAIGPLAAPFIAAVVSAYPAAALVKSTVRNINWLTEQSKQIRHAELGGSYTDTDYARRMRQHQLAELSSANQSFRRFIGQEASILHR